MGKVDHILVRRSALALPALAVLVTAAVATAAPQRKQDTNLAIAAYSIPTGVFPKLEAAYQGTAAGNGVKFSNSDRKSTRLNSSHLVISYAVFCLKKKKNLYHCTRALAR